MAIDLAIVPVAGHGTRLLPATKSQPKEMLPVGRKPVVQYVIDELALSGMQRVFFHFPRLFGQEPNDPRGGRIAL